MNDKDINQNNSPEGESNEQNETGNGNFSGSFNEDTPSDAVSEAPGIINQLLEAGKGFFMRPSSTSEPAQPAVIDSGGAIRNEEQIIYDESDFEEEDMLDMEESKNYVKKQIKNQLQQIETEIATTLSGLSSTIGSTSAISRLNALNDQKELVEKAQGKLSPQDENMVNVISRDVPFPKSYLRHSLIPIDIDENYYSEAAYLNTNPLQFLNQLQKIAQKRSRTIDIFSVAQKENMDSYDKEILQEIEQDRQKAVDIHYSIISAALHLHIYLQNMYDQYGHTMFIKGKQRIQDLMYPYEGHDPAYNLIDEKRKLIELKSFFGIFAELSEFLNSAEWLNFKKKIDNAVDDFRAKIVDSKEEDTNLDQIEEETESLTEEELKDTTVREYAIKKLRSGKKSLYTTNLYSWLTPYTSHPSPTKTVFCVEVNKNKKKVFGLFDNMFGGVRKFIPTPPKKKKKKSSKPKGIFGPMLPFPHLQEEMDKLNSQLNKYKKDLEREQNKSASLQNSNTGLNDEINKLEDQIEALKIELENTEQRIRAELLSELTASQTEMLDLGEIDIENLDDYNEIINSLQQVILEYINEGLVNIKHAENLGKEIQYDISKNLFYDENEDIKTDIISKMNEVRETVDRYLSRFYTSDKLLKPMFFIKFVYRHDTFLGKTGVGNIIHTFTLGPLEKQEIRVKTSETTREARESSSTIFDTASQSAQQEFDQSVSAERSSSSSSSVEVEKYQSSSVSASVSASGGFGPVSVGASFSASASSGSSQKSNSTHEQAAKNTQNASQKHVAQRQSQRDTTINEMSQSEKEKTKEQGYIRVIENPNPDVAMNYAFRQIIQEYISTISLVDIKLMFSNGVVVKEAPVSEMNNLIQTFIKPELKSVHEVIRQMVFDCCKIRDYKDRMINMLSSYDDGILRLRKDNYAKILEEHVFESDGLSEDPIFDLFKDIRGPLIHYWRFSLIQPGAVMIPEISYGSALGPQAREEFQMKVENWKNENESIALQNESIKVKNDLIREFLKILPTIKDEKLKVDAIFKLVNQSSEIADKLTILRLMSEGGADVSSIRKSLKLTP